MMTAVEFKLNVVGLTEWLTCQPREYDLRVVGTPFVLGDFDNNGNPTIVALARQAIKNLPVWTMEGCYSRFVVCGNFPIGIVSHEYVPDGAVMDRVFFEYIQMRPSGKHTRLSLKDAYGKGLYQKKSTD